MPGPDRASVVYGLSIVPPSDRNDLLTAEEGEWDEKSGGYRFDVAFLADRLVCAAWLAP